ncbi:hypothetical protein OIU85_003548 [Salix viminalis]|uniref:Uncharacterized protein n=1 Tax=Salix viminalis TaxID=40686 RepID=A0A9Q0PZD4_SALVM|nr:hypothetical protein OIU85_003548 [Salix viminalis]
MQQLRGRACYNRSGTAKSEAQLKEKYQLRLKVLEESLRGSSSSNRSAPEGRCISNGPPRRQSLNGAGQNHSFNQPCDGTKETETPNSWKGNLEGKPNEFPPADTERDGVPGILV